MTIRLMQLLIRTAFTCSCTSTCTGVCAEKDRKLHVPLATLTRTWHTVVLGKQYQYSLVANIKFHPLQNIAILKRHSTRDGHELC